MYMSMSIPITRNSKAQRTGEDFRLKGFPDADVAVGAGILPP